MVSSSKSQDIVCLTQASLLLDSYLKDVKVKPHTGLREKVEIRWEKSEIMSDTTKFIAWFMLTREKKKCECLYRFRHKWYQKPENKIDNRICKHDRGNTMKYEENNCDSLSPELGTGAQIGSILSKPVQGVINAAKNREIKIE